MKLLNFTRLAPAAFLITISCSKLIEVDPPSNSITTDEVFENDRLAQSVISGIYYNMVNSATWFTSGNLSFYCGLSADELVPFYLNDQLTTQFYYNTLLSDNSNINLRFWTTPYKAVYAANNVIEALSVKATPSDSIKNESLAEARFIRAFSNFYLVNLFGPIPLITTANWRKSNLLSRSPEQVVYDQIIADLLYAKEHLPANYSASKGERILPNYYGAIALLARVYLYLEDWENAEKNATEIIQNHALYSLVSLNNVFAPNNNEAIWQLKQQNFRADLFASPEGKLFIPAIKNAFTPPRIYLSRHLLDTFDTTDNRKKFWIDSTLYKTDSNTYYYPYKYKVGNNQTGNKYTEYHTVFRLAEVYLIRAEARLQKNNIKGAVVDLNSIRQRASLEPISEQATGAEVTNALMKERQLELFAEWGHRWLDLKRWRKTDAVLSQIKGNNWQGTDAYYAIPVNELITNPNLSQNPGYQ